MLWAAVPLSVRLPLDSSSLRFHVNCVASTVPVLLVTVTADLRKKVVPDSSALLPVVVADAPEICAAAGRGPDAAITSAAINIALRMAIGFSLPPRCGRQGVSVLSDGMQSSLSLTVPKTSGPNSLFVFTPGRGVWRG